jgi:hypothetical protein
MIHVAFQINLFGTPHTLGFVWALETSGSGASLFRFLSLVEVIQRTERVNVDRSTARHVERDDVEITMPVSEPRTKHNIWTHWQHLDIRAKVLFASLFQLPLTKECAKCWFPTGSVC